MWFLALLACAVVSAGAENQGDVSFHRNTRAARVPNKIDTSSGCLYEGRWHASGARVSTREACLACACAGGALACRRRACAPLPAPPPRCHVVHRKGQCCPEIHCPDGVRYTEHVASARLEDSDTDGPTSIGHACVEGGTVYAAGSAMTSGTACEQCFCLGGARRCVRPRCLPPPPACRARPAPGACCPQRYYCDHNLAEPVNDSRPQDCVSSDGSRVSEGQRVPSSEDSPCTQCFCLRGAVRCQHLSCAPALLSCTPLVAPGQCCPHQYQCHRNKNGTATPNLHVQRQNLLMSLSEEDRSFHASKSTKRETTIKELPTATDKSTSTSSVTNKELVTTTKGKRETATSFAATYTTKSDKSEITTFTMPGTTQRFNEVTTKENDLTTKLATTVTEETTTEEEISTEQPEGSVKIIINGTINCTAALSSTSLFLNMTDTNDTDWVKSDIQPRIPMIDTTDIESHTFPPNDIITERTHDDGFDENETFTINVTSSLNSNTSHSTASTTPKTAPPALIGNALNITKLKKKEEYDYDYTEPTLPPSLPNLKIIPFVAADAVVDDDISSKESPPYPVLEREDKFPVYYPSIESKEKPYATRREDVYDPTQYPVFVSKKVESKYPDLVREPEAVHDTYPATTNDLSPVREYTVTASLGNSPEAHKIDSTPSVTNTKFNIETPAVNLFSPPIETEGGFIPKGPEIIDDYYSIYSSTPSGPILPHLTTSMQLEPKDECISSDGRRVPEGASVRVSCAVCACAWGELHCTPRACPAPPGCTRRPATTSSGDMCCGDIVCSQGNITSPLPQLPTSELGGSQNESDVAIKTDDETTNNTIKENSTSSYTDTLILQNSTDYSNVASGDNNDMNNKSENETKLNSTHSSTERTDLLTTTNNQSVEYEDEDDDSYGLTLGNVLQLLLRETYESTVTTTNSPPKKKTTTPQASTPLQHAANYPTTNKRPPTFENAFIPVTHRLPYTPPKILYPPNVVNRIDHLVLGETSSIWKTTVRPPVTFRPSSTLTTKRHTTTSKTTPKPATTKSVEISSKEGFVGQSVDIRPSVSNLLGLGSGLPKLAGCNIYGRMYRVERIIQELSSACQECRCTELGVQCRTLSC